jgi:hypothetical protein
MWARLRLLDFLSRCSPADSEQQRMTFEGASKGAEISASKNGAEIEDEQANNGDMGSPLVEIVLPSAQR